MNTVDDRRARSVKFRSQYGPGEIEYDSWVMSESRPPQKLGGYVTVDWLLEMAQNLNRRDVPLPTCAAFVQNQLAMKCKEILDAAIATEPYDPPMEKATVGFSKYGRRASREREDA